MRTLSATEVAQIIVCILLIIMTVIGIIKICMNWYNSNDDDGYDEMRNNIIATTLSNHENHKAEAKERLRLDIAAQIAAALSCNPSCNHWTADKIASQSFVQANALIRRWEQDKPTKSEKPFIKEDK